MHYDKIVKHEGFVIESLQEKVVKNVDTKAIQIAEIIETENKGSKHPLSLGVGRATIDISNKMNGICLILDCLQNYSLISSKIPMLDS